VGRELVRSARERGTALTGPGGLKALTRTVIETALDESWMRRWPTTSANDKHDPPGRGRAIPTTGGSSSRRSTDADASDDPAALPWRRR